ncbi:MAG: hypothetical protein ACKOA9_10680 [Actinomycetota bacterium]
MRVMLVGTLPGAIDRTEEILQSGGHEVLHCRDERAGTFPCTALTERGSCPFETAPVDVVVTTRDRAWPRPTPTEDGALCAIRRLVPLVVHGVTALDPFAPWAAAETSTDAALLDAVGRVATGPLPEHGGVATATVQDLLAGQGITGDPSAAEVRRSGGRLVVTLRLTAAAEPYANAMTVKILTALRGLDPYADGIDVICA